MSKTETPITTADREKATQLAMLDRAVVGFVRRQQETPTPRLRSQSEPRKLGKAPHHIDNKGFILTLEALLQGYNRPSIKNSMHEVSSRFRDFEAEKHISDEELRRLPPNFQDLILALAERIRDIRLTDQTDAQPTASTSLERVTPPLPTAEDIAQDPLKTWVGRDKSIRVMDEEGQLQPESPLDLFKRVYAPWVGVITKGHIRHIDPSLYTAFNNWTKNGKNSIPEAVLPNLLRRWNDSTQTTEEKLIYNKINALRRRKAS